MRKPHFLVLCLLGLSPALANAEDVPAYAAAFEKTCRELVAGTATSTPDQRLDALMKAYWDYEMQDDSEWATYAGYPGQNNRWTDYSPGNIALRKRLDLLTLDAVRAIPREKLSKSQRLNHVLLLREAETAVEGDAFPSEYLQMSQLDGIHHDTADAIASMPHATEKDYRDILARLMAMARRVDQAIALMALGVKAGVTPPRVTLGEVPQQIANLNTDDPLQSAYLAPFAAMPETIPADQREKLLAKAKEIYATGVQPALKKLHAFARDIYLPGAREPTAATALPNGKAWYAHLARSHTTTGLTPQQIHDIGLKEVARIRGEMEKVLAETGFQGALPEFFNFLRTDPRFFHTDKDALLVSYRDIAKRADAGLIRLFSVLPRLPYGVEPIPAYAEKSQTTAYYQPGAPSAARPGIFFANTYDLKSRPKWEMEALTLHEAVPGHHLQMSLAKELDGLPDFRKESEMTAFVEGWGLYAESLGSELGFYREPYARFGQLSYEMWRAIRLVVDTGMHALGWTREQAIAYFEANAGKASHDIKIEVDRYLVWPGQALAYKLGELKIKELRDYARGALGDRFDIRAFHDEVLGEGPLPLDVLDARVRGWVKEQGATAP